MPPYSETFASRGDDSGYTVINANSDNKTWGYTGSYGGGMNAPYNSKLASDDWLITPPVEMTKGYSYKITLKIKGTGSARSEEKFEMSGGTAPTVEGMATKIIEPTIMTGNTQNTYEVYFTATETRPYYFGVHAISDPNKYGILVNGLTIDKGTTPLAPDAVTFVKSVTDYNGEPKATITVKAPLLAGDGTELPGITKIDVKMGDEVVKTFNNVTPGSEFSFDMTVDKDGAYDLTFVPYLEENEGKTLTQNVYIGMGVPSSVATTAIVEDSEKTGTANLTWSAVNTDVNGASLNPDLFTYTITTMDASGQEVTIAKDISDTSYSVKEVSDGEQAFVSYMIYAVNRVGSSEAVQTDMIPVGTPYEVPFIESFANRQASHAFVQGCLRGLQNDAWGVSGDTDIIDFTSYDHDNGFAVLLAYDTEIYALYSAKIDLSGIENPSLSYYTFCIDADDVNILTSQISLDGVNWITLKENIENELPKIGWNRISVSLDEYKGKTVQFRWVGEVELYSHIFLDNIRIEKGLNCDAAATSITAPQKAEASSDYVISATVENLSSGRELKDVTVNLYKNGNKIDEKQIETIGIDGTETVEFNQTASLIEEKDNTFYIDVMTEGDENSDNNATATVTVTTKMPNHPAVTTLEGSLTDNYNNVSLTWAEPDLSHALKDPYTETFESAETSTVFPNTFGDWTFVDKDMKPIGGVKNLSLPGIETGSRQSYFVVDNTYDDFSHFDAKSFEAHSGTKYLSNMYLGEGGRVNDWAISPELPGCEQEISFYVKNADERYSETFEFLYSTTDMENFIMVSEHEVGNCDWNRFVYTVPEGTKYFAIRCKSNSKLMMFIDDVTYIPTGVATDYEIEGYNIYRDGLKLNDAPVKATAYNDILESAGTYTYCVTTIYKGKGESKASNKVKVEATLGIHNVYGSKKAVSTDNYDTLGRLIVGNPFPGTVVITKTKYDDGSVTVSKHIAR